MDHLAETQDNPIMRELVELRMERDELRAELATARALLADYQGMANRLREEVAALRFAPGEFYRCGCPAVKVTDMIKAFCPEHIKGLVMPQPARSYTCPYCQKPVTDLQYHEGPEDCAREVELPQWEPHITPTRRMLEAAADEDGGDTDPRG